MIARVVPILLLFLTLLPGVGSGQDNPDALDSQTVSRKRHLTPEQMNEMIVARDFPDIPAHVRDLNEQGTMLVYIKVNAEGKAELVGPGVLKPLSPVPVFDRCPRVVKDPNLLEYVRNAVYTWKFRSLVVNSEPVPYSGWTTVIFWYGSFLEKPPY